jgi:hypothetical protein
MDSTAHVFPFLICQASSLTKNGNELQKVTLTNINHVKSAKLNLLSLTKSQQNACRLNSNKNSIWLTKDNQKIVFDNCNETTEGLIFAMNHKQFEKAQEANAIGSDASAKDRDTPVISINEDMCHKTCKALGWKVRQGVMGLCTSCTMGKAQQKNINISQDE